jgi:hypothetical protein
MYHAMADVVDEESGTRYLYLLSKAQASYSKDAKTRNKTKPGEKPLPKEYLTLVRCIVDRTTENSHGHSLGIVVAMDIAYCAFCKAGGTGQCIHVSQTLHVQRLHWGPGRKVLKPSTIDLCSWKRRGAGHNSSVMAEASKLMCQNLPKSDAEGAYRMERAQKRNATEGLSAKYDQWDGDETKRSKLKSKIMFSIARPAVATFFALNQQANAAQYRDPAPWESSNKEK